MTTCAEAPPKERASARPPLDIADIFRAHGETFAKRHVLSAEQRAVLRAITQCRTAALGGHADVCDGCGYAEYSYNSCRNRHCPKCQATAQARWVEQRMDRVLPTHAFHVVFTLPSELRVLALTNRETLFNLLFTCATQTLLELGRDPVRLGAELGITSVLHTWTRELIFHPHVHCIVTGGGLSLDGERWVPCRRDYLFPVRVLGSLFRGKMLAHLRAAYDASELRLDGPAAQFTDRRRFQRLCDKLEAMRWVVYAKPPFGGPEQVFRYLGRYTHRVGISSQRLMAFDEHAVTFWTRGSSTATLAPDEFVRRFLLHVLPARFVKIRHHGLMAPVNIRTKLAAARRLLQRDPPAAPAPTASAVRDFLQILCALATATEEPPVCPHCHTLLRRHLLKPGETLPPTGPPSPP